MKRGGEGACRFCNKTFSGSTIGRHLQTCGAKKEKDVAEAQRMKPGRIFHIKVVGGRKFWLHIEMNASSKLTDLDEFLRHIWLECCGHLSQFIIAGEAYMPSNADDLWNDMDARPMNVRLDKVLDVKDTFEYEYDFGSSTYLGGQIVSERMGVMKERVRILARNRIPEVFCSKCEKPAVWFCTDCEGFYCGSCLDEHQCGEEMALPVVNSPRMGVCGYTGEQDPDGFEKAKIHEERKPGELPEMLKKYLENRKNSKL